MAIVGNLFVFLSTVCVCGCVGVINFSYQYRVLFVLDSFGILRLLESRSRVQP